MKEFLTKLKLIDNLTIVLSINKIEFVKRLSGIVDESNNLGFMSDSFDIFSFSKKELKGNVNLDGFKLKRKRRFFDTNMNTAIADGAFSEKNGELIIDIEVNGFTDFFLAFYFIFAFVYIILIFTFISDNDFFAVSLVFLQGLFMLLMTYFMMKSSVKRLKYQLEREFFYLTKK